MQSYRSFLLPVLSLALLLLLWVPSEVQAQIIFDAELSERGQRAVTDCENMAQLVEIVGEHGIIIFEGEKPVSARQIVFIVGERGEVRERIASEPFKLEPGKRRLGEHFPRRQFLALFEELFPDDYFFPDDFFFPDDYFLSGDDNPIIGEQVFDEMKMEKGQIGLVVAVQPEDLRAGEEMIRLRPKIHPMGFVLSHDRK